MKYLEIHTSKFSMHFNVYGVHPYPKRYKCPFMPSWFGFDVTIYKKSFHWAGQPYLKRWLCSSTKRATLVWSQIGREPKNHLSGSIFESSEVFIWSMPSSSSHHIMSILLRFFYLHRWPKPIPESLIGAFFSSGCWNAASDSFQPIFCSTWCWCEGRPSSALICSIYICSMSIIV